MAINQERVNVVCEAMDADGKAPTLAAVREALGEGSFSTLARMVKVWKAGRVDVEPVAVAVEVPEAVQAAGARMAAMVWAEAERLAAERLAAERADMEASKAEMAAELETAYQEMEQVITSERNKHRELEKMGVELSQRSWDLTERCKEVQALQIELAAMRGELEGYRAVIAKINPGNAGQTEKKPAPGRKKAAKIEPGYEVDTKTKPLEI